MRVSTSMIFNNGTAGIQTRQSDLYRLQNQLSTGRRILSPSDDPIATAEALKVTQSKEVNQQFVENQGNATAQLTYLETTLANTGDILVRLNELAAGAGSPTYNATQRGIIATEMSQLRDNLIGLANTRDGTGLYIFSGFKSATEPFQLNTPASPAAAHSLASNGAVSYQGDAGGAALQVTASRTMVTAENGLDIFMQVKDASGAPTGRSMFDGLQNMIDILDGTRPFTQADYSQAVGDLSASLNHTLTAQASVGARLNALDGLTSAGKDNDVLYQSRLSELQDLDWTKAISEFTNVQTQLEAAQLTFKQSSQLSLFNII
jgi:flagellar hook-associated protein 3 FlgL